MNKRVLALLVAGTLWAMSAVADETARQEAAPETGTGNLPAAEQSDNPRTGAPANVTATPDTVIPSEEIPEDLSVSFPVDI